MNFTSNQQIIIEYALYRLLLAGDLNNKAFDLNDANNIRRVIKKINPKDYNNKKL